METDGPRAVGESEAKEGGKGALGEGLPFCFGQLRKAL